MKCLERHWLYGIILGVDRLSCDWACILFSECEGMKPCVLLFSLPIAFVRSQLMPQLLDTACSTRASVATYLLLHHSWDVYFFFQSVHVAAVSARNLVPRNFSNWFFTISTASLSLHVGTWATPYTRRDTPTKDRILETFFSFFNYLVLGWARVSSTAWMNWVLYTEGKRSQHVVTRSVARSFGVEQCFFARHTSEDSLWQIGSVSSVHSRR